VLKLSKEIIESDDPISYKYKHNDWVLSYKYYPASAGFENAQPLVLIHPVGIGQSSWFYNNLINSFKESGHPTIYAPDLIGCGIENGGDAWVPKDRGLHFPLSWVQGCESLINNVIIPHQMKMMSTKNVVVLAQGGLAPVGVLLAARNSALSTNIPTVSHLILTSPPSWLDMTTSVPQVELERNYNFLQSNVAQILFPIIEARFFVRLFSNLFLFENECDNKWLDLSVCIKSTLKRARPPIIAFNAGFCQHRSFERELVELIDQPTLIISGTADIRKAEREVYERKIRKCKVETAKGKNVLPWENPGAIKDEILRFAYLSMNRTKSSTDTS